MWCTPPVGSTTDLLRFAGMIGCERSWAPKVNYCMNKVFAGLNGRGFNEKAVDRPLLLPSIVDARLREALPAHEPPVKGTTRYTFVPAAAGTKESELTLEKDFFSGRVKPSNRAVVQVVDFARWLNASFTTHDYVLLKMDIEGAEHAVVPRLVETGAIRLIDRLAFECHDAKKECKATLKKLKQASVEIVHDQAYGPRMYRGRHVSGGCKPGECYEPMTHDYWRHRVGEFQRDLESAACKHVNVSLAPRAVAERLLWSNDREQQRKAERLLAGL